MQWDQVAQTSFLQTPLSPEFKEDVETHIEPGVAICYNIKRTFILEFNIAQIFKCTLKCRSTWPLKLRLHDIYFC